jgi:hypothetical protein
MIADGGLRRGLPGPAADEASSVRGPVMWHNGVRSRHFLDGAPVAAAMKGPWQLHRRGPGTGAVATKVSRHGGGGGDDAVPATATCAPITSLMVVQRWQRAREMKIGK